MRACGAEMAAGAGGVRVLVAARGRRPEEDAARLGAVRAAIGPDAALIADANCAMTLEEATAFAEAARPLGLAWPEEPVRGNDRRALAALAASGVALGAGQMEQGPDRFALLIEAGVAVIQPNAVVAGGFGAAVEAARAAQGAGRSVAPGGGWEPANLQWVCGVLGAGAVELHRGQTAVARLLAPEGPARADGVLRLPDVPGLGFTPDEEGLARCRLA